MNPVILALLVLTAGWVLLLLLGLLVLRDLRVLRVELDLVGQQAHRVQAEVAALRATLDRVIADPTVRDTPVPGIIPVRVTVRGDRKEEK